jgi:hypothetical protein
MNNQMGARLVFENCKKAMLTAGYTQDQINNAVLSQSYLRLEQPVSLTSTLFTFPILNNQTTSGNAIRATEQRLNQQDFFYVSEIGFYLNKASSATVTNGVDYTFPNPVAFPNSSANLESVYNGNLQIQINNSNIITAMDIKRFKQVPQTQLTAATNSPQDEFDGANDRSAQIVIEPNVLLFGTKNNVISINLPGAIGGTADVGSYLVVVFRGLLAQNTTIVA